MKYLINVCLIIVSISLISCGGVVQPLGGGKAEQIEVTENTIVKVVTATPNKAVQVTADKTVVHVNIKGESVTIVAGLKTPSPVPTPVWIDNEVVIVNPTWHNVIELQIGQQLAVMPLPYRRYEWEPNYDTQVLEVIDNISQSKAPEAGWIWRTKNEGETTLRFSSGPPLLKNKLSIFANDGLFMKCFYLDLYFIMTLPMKVILM